MKLKLLTAFLFLISIQSFAQDQKWSVETNYGVVPQDGFGGNDNIIDFGLKYRFTDIGIMRFGFGVNAGISKFDYTIFIRGDGGGLTESIYIQPRLFSEFIIPGSEKFRPSLGFGYSIIGRDFEQRFEDIESFGNTRDGGFNFNIGFSYDITKRFFVQAQYDFINLRVRDEFISNGEVVKPDFNRKLNNIKLGVGFRF